MMKLIRIIGLVLFFAGFVVASVYMAYVRTSGTVVASVPVATKTLSADQKQIQRYLKIFNYYDLQFAPVVIPKDIQNAKLSLVIARGGLLPTYKDMGLANYKEMISPDFRFVRTSDGLVVAEKSDWFKAGKKTLRVNGKIYEMDVREKNTNAEGRVDKNKYFMIGMLDTLAAGEYMLNAQNMIFRDSRIIPFHKEFSLEVRADAVVQDMKYYYIAFGLTAFGALLLALTRPRIKT